MKLAKKNQPKPGKLTHIDEMIQEITIVNNKVVNELPLLPGTYTIAVISNKERTRKEWEMYWFSIIDEFVLQTGNDKYTTHELFKQHYGISSTKDLQSESDWQVAVNALKCWTLINS